MPYDDDDQYAPKPLSGLARGSHTLPERKDWRKTKPSGFTDDGRPILLTLQSKHNATELLDNEHAWTGRLTDSRGYMSPRNTLTNRQAGYDMRPCLKDENRFMIVGPPQEYDLQQALNDAGYVKDSYDRLRTEKMDETFEIAWELMKSDEKGDNAPTNPGLWSQAKSKARSKFKVYPSAYANGWASKWYKSKGGGWKKKGKRND